MTQQQGIDGHDKYGELCALAMTGTLSPEEGAELKAHLQTCEGCRAAYADYLVLTRAGIPMLASRYGHHEEPGSWDDLATRRKLFAWVEAAEKKARVLKLVEQPPQPPRFLIPRRSPIRAVVQLAVAACLVGVVGLGAYRFGRRAEAVAKHAQVSTEDRFRMLAAEKKAVDDLLSSQSQKLTQLQGESTEKQLEIMKLRSELQTFKDRANEIAAAKTGSEEQLHGVSQQRDALSAQLQTAQESYQNVQGELASLRAEREKTRLQITSLENQIGELSAVNRDQQRRLDDSAQYLSSDRDIRELMGARQLYIADVFDVSSDSRTRKPFGRVFYTKGKSLIFYAFDLDRQPGIKNTSTFQAWGGNESDQGRPLNLGILYLDNETNRRWALRFDDPKKLAEIDAVFVTVEPHGGSNRPTGKPFLYASLRKEANHP
jgi:predicted  nucleic acid-binding Zn-ribbon protein